LIIKTPPIRQETAPKATQLKYLSINFFIPGPPFQISKDISKYLVPQLIIDSIKNINRFKSKAPEVTLKFLNGTGANPVIEPIVQINAYLNDFNTEHRQSVINNISDGTGKKTDCLNQASFIAFNQIIQRTSCFFSHVSNHLNHYDHLHDILWSPF
jgi:hypothetical protein